MLDLDRLEQLTRMRDSGVLTEQEFEQAKARLLSEAEGSPDPIDPQPAPTRLSAGKGRVSARSAVAIAAGLVVALLIGVGIYGHKSSVSANTGCSADASTNIILSVIRDNLEKSLRASLTNGDPNANQPVQPSNIRYELQKLNFSLSNIRTDNNSNETSKRNCNADISVQIPADMYNSINSARQTLNENNINQFSDLLGLKAEADKFTGTITYLIQPTDDGTHIYGETANGTPFVKFVTEVLSDSLQAAAIAQNQQQQNAAAAAQAAADQANLAAKLKADLDMAQTENRLAVQTLNAIWQSIPADVRHQLLPEQRAWIAKTQADCRVEASSTSTDPTELRTAQINCETKANRDRIGTLQQYRNQEPSSQPTAW